MTLFWTFAAVASLAALLWLGGWRSRAELTRTDAMKLVAMLLVPALAFGVYFIVGLPSAVTAVAGAEPHEAGDLNQLAERLAAKLEANPDDQEGWELLATTYDYLGREDEARAARAHVAGDSAAPATEKEQNPRDAEAWAQLGRSQQGERKFADAARSFAQATALRPNDASLWADRADAEAAAGGGGLASVAKLIDTALRLDPDEPKALWLAGTLALELGNQARALKHWRHMEQVLPAGDPRLEIIRANIAELAPQPVATTTAIRGTVSLSAQLAAKVRPGDTVFVFARATDGSPMPLAVWRAKAEGFPLRFTLDAATQLAPERPLAAYEQLLIGARISRSGNGAAEPGDFEAAPRTLRPTAGGDLNLVVDHTV